MNYLSKAILFILFSVNFVYAQVLPPSGTNLNYIQVMLEHDPVFEADAYLIQLTEKTSAGRFDTLLLETIDSSTAGVVRDLEFGKKYFWRYAGLKNDKRITEWFGPYNFSTKTDPVNETGSFRCRVITNNTDINAGGLLLPDNTKMIIDRTGHPVWFLPRSNKFFKKITNFRDVRMTTVGTITLLANNYAIECNLAGEIIWQAPNDGAVSKDTTEFYNHDFRRLANGHYIVLGEKYSWKKIPSGFPTEQFSPENVRVTDNVTEVKILYSTIIEYNLSKQIVWSWNSADYLSDLDLFSESTNTNSPRMDLPEQAEIFGHMNAIDIDSSGEFIYAGFRDISRIIKIEKKTGNVVFSWGNKMPSGEAQTGDGLFLNQHGLVLLPDNNILIFNNNGMSKKAGSSSVQEISAAGEIPARIVWQFDCKFDSLGSGKSPRSGNADLLPDNNILVCMGGLNRVFEVTKDSPAEVVWDGFMESYSNTNATWSPINLYRTHYCSSLYPNYFTLQNNRKPVTREDPYILKIFNDGSEADSYQIFVMMGEKKILQNFQTPPIAPGNSANILIDLSKVSKDFHDIGLTVQSKTNPLLVKKTGVKLN